MPDLPNSLRHLKAVRKFCIFLTTFTIFLVMADYAAPWMAALLAEEHVPRTSPLTLTAIGLALMATLLQRPMRRPEPAEKALWGGVILLACAFPLSAQISIMFLGRADLGEMGWNTALGLMCLAVSQLLRVPARSVGLGLVSLALFQAVVALSGHLQAEALFFGKMSITTAVMLVALSIASAVRFVRHPWLVTIMRRSIPGTLIRMQLLLWLSISLLGSLAIRLEKNGPDHIGPFVHTLEMFAFLGIILWFGQRFAGLLHSAHRAERQVRETYGRDPLTGLATRKAAQEHFDNVRGDLPIGVILFDLDNLKKINDISGHDHGDLVLKTVADAAKDVVGTDALLVRWGGEEFLVISRAADLEAVHAQSAQLQRAIASINVAGAENPITASFGATLAFTSRLPALRDCVIHADRALYMAKQAGRNCVRLAFGRTIWDPAHILDRQEKLRLA